MSLDNFSGVSELSGLSNAEQCVQQSIQMLQPPVPIYVPTPKHILEARKENNNTSEPNKKKPKLEYVPKSKTPLDTSQIPTYIPSPMIRALSDNECDHKETYYPTDIYSESSQPVNVADNKYSDNKNEDILVENNESKIQNDMKFESSSIKLHRHSSSSSKSSNSRSHSGSHSSRHKDKHSSSSKESSSHHRSSNSSHKSSSSSKLSNHHSHSSSSSSKTKHSDKSKEKQTEKDGKDAHHSSSKHKSSRHKGDEKKKLSKSSSSSSKSHNSSSKKDQNSTGKSSSGNGEHIDTFVDEDKLQYDFDSDEDDVEAQCRMIFEEFDPTSVAKEDEQETDSSEKTDSSNAKYDNFNAKKRVAYENADKQHKPLATFNRKSNHVSNAMQVSFLDTIVSCF